MPVWLATSSARKNAYSVSSERPWSICAGPFPVDDPAQITHLKGPYHCSYRYALSRGKRGLRIKYDVDGEARAITVYDLGPRGDVY